MKLLGVDYGRRRIGTAISDETGITTRGLKVIDRKIDPDPLKTIASLFLEHVPEAVVFGLPLGPDDQETIMSLEVRAFAAQLIPLLPERTAIHFVDESFSSVEAHVYMSDHTRKKKREQRGAADLIAACTIIRNYLREKDSPVW